MAKVARKAKTNVVGQSNDGNVNDETAIENFERLAISDEKVEKRRSKQEATKDNDKGLKRSSVQGATARGVDGSVCEAPVDGLCIVTMNASPKKDPKDIENPRDKRRQVIRTVVEDKKPAIVFFQEFQSKGILGSIWKAHDISSFGYTYHGHKEGSYIINENLLKIGTLSDLEMRSILKELQRKPNEDGVVIPMDFDPFPRMKLLRVIQPVIDAPACEYICVSIHGPWKKSKNDRIKYFEYLMAFFTKVIEKKNMPMIIGGDFNVNMPDIEKKVEHPFTLHEYRPTERRQNEMKDYFIVSEGLELENVESIDFEKDEKYSDLFKFSVNQILDHDPIVAFLRIKQVRTVTVADSR